MMMWMMPATTLYDRALLETGSEMMKTSPVTSADVSDPIAELFRVIAKNPPMQGALLWTPGEAAGLLQDCTN